MPTDALVAQALPSLINGVSQQPSNLRMTSQAEAQVNMLSGVADGVTVRPPMEHVALLSGSFNNVPTGGVKIHPINLGNGLRYFAVVEDGDINVYDDDGAEVTVTDAAAGSPGSYTYLDFDTSAYTAEEAFSLVTVADYTFVLNKTRTVAMSGSTSAARTQAHEFMLVIGLPNSTAAANVITVNIGGTVVSAGGGSNTSDGIADTLCTALCGVTDPSTTTGTAGGSVNDWKFTRVTDNIIYAYQFQGTNDAVVVSDKVGDTIHKLYATGTSGEAPTAARFSDLPAKGKDGFKILVKGDQGNSDDDFWVVYSAAEHIWKETVEPSLDDNFSAVTMPHALVYAAGAFTFQPLTWNARLVGDETSAPQISAVGKKISDIVVHKNRLVLMSDENAIASESGDFFAFWPSTVTSIIDSDPFDVAGTGNTVAVWDFAVPYLGNLSLFSSTGNVQGELVGSRDEALTIKNARIEERSSYAHKAVRPLNIGSALYFLNERGEHSAVHTYTRVDYDAFDADEITSHIRKYLPKDIDRMSGSSAENMLVFLSKNTSYRNRMYVYRFHYLGNEQVMSSWSYWDIEADGNILAACWFQSLLYLFIERQDGIHLELMDFGKTDEDEGAGATPLGYRVHLDSLISVTGTYSAGTNLTSFTIPYAQYSNGGTYMAIKGGAWGSTRGASLGTLVNLFDNTLKISGDYSAHPVYIGRVFDWSYELSQIHVRDQRSGAVARGRETGNLRLRRAKATYKNSGAFKVEVRSRQDSDVLYDLFAAASAPSTLESGAFQFDIGGDSRDVRIIFTNSSTYPHLPATLSSIDWEGSYFQHSDQA